MADVVVTSPCPSCGAVARRTTYDVGSGPELSCASCEWCWGAEGQPLKPLVLNRRMLARLVQPTELVAQDRAAWPAGHPCRDCGRLFGEHPTRQCDGWR